MNYSEISLTQSINTFMYKVYAWMALALSITAFTAYAVAATPQLYVPLLTNAWLFFGLMIAQLVCVFSLIMFLPRVSFAAAFTLFMVYSILTGISVSSIFLIYTTSSIAATLFVTAGMFSCMAVYGYFTRSDLSGMGSMLLMGLIGIILAGLVNLFLQNPIFNLFISGAGVLIFTLLTAYDVQKIKLIGQSGILSGQAGKAALVGALTLYLDFINLFLYLLQFMGKRRKE